MDNELQQLHHARESSDSGLMQHKATVLGHMMRCAPQDWEVDSNAQGAFPGITHIPTGYRFHAPRTAIPRQLLNQQLVDPVKTGPDLVGSLVERA